MLHASPYGKRTEECDCPPGTGLACPHLCRYSAPEADWNWESSQAAWVFGYRFYEFTAAHGEELPLCIGMSTKPQQNDAIAGYVSLLQYHRLTGRPLHEVLLDSAHDNEPTYRLVRSLSAIPVIDLNSGNPRGRIHPDYPAGFAGMDTVSIKASSSASRHTGEALR